MKNAVRVLCAISFVLVLSSSALAETLRGSYAFSASGEAVANPSPLVFTPVAMAGAFTFDRDTASGSRVMTIGGNPVSQPATMTCTVSTFSADGIGDLACDVTETLVAPFPIRRESWRIVLADHGREIRLLFLGGEPLLPGVPPMRGAVISGSASKQ